MDVSKPHQDLVAQIASDNKLDNVNAANPEELGGEELLHAVVSLTGLPEGMVYDELDQILKMTPTKRESGDLTMQELRTALLAYLESLGENLEVDLSEIPAESPHRSQS